MSRDEIKKKRYSLGLSQKDFAAALVISIQTVQAWEQGIRKPSEMALFKIKALK